MFLTKAPLDGIEKTSFINKETIMKKKSEIIYSLDVSDVQTVALEEIDRELTKKEIESILDSIANKIPWFDAIADSINEIIKQPKKKNK